MSQSLVALVRGSGEVGSAVAHRLFRAGWQVMLQDVQSPAHTRRKSSFCDAFFEGAFELEGVTAKLSPMVCAAGADLDHVVATSMTLDDVLAAARPNLLVDARMRKRIVPEAQRGMAPLTIGLGPGFVAGETVDVAVETAWGPRLGTILDHGPTQPATGQPRPLGAYGSERFIVAPRDGTFRTRRGIGETVEPGDVLGGIGDTEMRARLPGRLRGLSHDGASVEVGTRIAELDPREDPDPYDRIGVRPGAIAGAVLLAASRLGRAATR